MDAFLSILFRLLHIIPATIAVGGLFVMHIILPIGLAQIDPEQSRLVYLKCRRIFKISIHASATFLVISGVYNFIANRAKYHATIPQSHALFGTHALLGFTAIVIAFVTLAPKEPRPSHRKWASVILTLFLLTVVVGSSLKWVRDHAPVDPSEAISRGVVDAH